MVEMRRKELTKLARRKLKMAMASRRRNSMKIFSFRTLMRRKKRRRKDRGREMFAPQTRIKKIEKIKIILILKFEKMETIPVVVLLTLVWSLLNMPNIYKHSYCLNSV